MIKKIFYCICGTAIVSVLISVAVCTVSLYSAIHATYADDIRTETAGAAARLESLPGAAERIDWMHIVSDVKRAPRYTWVAADGTVLFDSAVFPDTEPVHMENHRNRPEIQAALQTGSGKAVRYSNTLTEMTIYHAVRLDDGSVLRLSRLEKTELLLLSTAVQPVCYLLFVLLIVSALLALRMANYIIEPVVQLDLEHPEANTVYEELSPLLVRISEQKRDIMRGVEKLNAQQQEFAGITAHMQEGLIVLNPASEVLSLNESALRIFGCSRESCCGKNALHINRSEPFARIVEMAAAGKKASAEMRLDGRWYEISANPAASPAPQSTGGMPDADASLGTGGMPDAGASHGTAGLSGATAEQPEPCGSVLLVVDITARREMEQQRREFSANVSHELKTPLTSISGYAELIRDGLAQPADIPQFAGRIVSESARLQSLIQDIIKLSRLDEKHIATDMQSEKVPVSLEEIVSDVFFRLKPVAEKKQVSLRVSGSCGAITGVRHILDELVFNLCDNAVKYNVPGGTVSVELGTGRADGAYISVADTGIGIPDADRQKVFERFFRVDKSRSKETGGTGLGLSIVKHAAEYHNARIQLESTIGKGTVITVFFPR